MKIINIVLINLIILSSLNASTSILGLSTEGMEPHYRVATEGPVFPCELEGDLPGIDIYGENHIGPNAEKMSVVFNQLASRGDIYLGREGQIYGEEYTDYKAGGQANMKKYVFGLEEEVFQALVGIARGYNDMVYMSGKHQEMAHIRVLLSIGTNPIHKKAFKNIPSTELYNEYGEDMAVSLQLFAAARSQEEFIQHYLALNRTTFADVSNEVYIKFTKRLGLELMNEFTKTHLDYDVTNIVNFFEHPENREYLDKFTLEDTVLVRNQHFIQSLGKEYCKHYKEGKRFILSVGALHIEDLEKQIKKHSDGKVQVQSINFS